MTNFRNWRSTVTDGENFLGMEGVARTASEFESTLMLDEGWWVVTTVEMPN